MAWDVGEAVAVVGEDFAAAWEIAVGDTAREGEINHRLTGKPIRVRGIVAATDAGVTDILVGLEVQNATRSVTDTVTYSVPIGAVDTFTSFEGWITPDADHVWGRPYIDVQGSAGTAQFGAVYLERNKTAPGDVSNSWPIKETATLSVSHAPSTGVEVFSKSVTTRGGPLEVTVAMDLDISSGQEFDILIYVDATYAGGSTPTGYARKSQVKTGTSNTMRWPVVVHHWIGDPNDPVTDPPLAAGAHTIKVYVRNATNAGVDITDRTFQAREHRNDPVA